MLSARRASVLREMGLGPLWQLRSRAGEAGGAGMAADEASAAPPEVGEMPAAAAPRAPAAPTRHTSAAARGASAASPVRAPLPAEPRHSPAPRTTDTTSHAAATDPARSARIAGLEWDQLEAEIRACRACRLCEKRKQAVPGVGDRKAGWLFVGEGPGSEEDQRGEPFVGPAGKLLDNMLSSIGLQRADGVYIANAVKCRPPHNRTPEPDEIAACLPFLQRQIELLQPRLIVALGRPAAQALLGGEVKIGAARGKRFECDGVPVVVTYHPAYLLRNQWDTAKAWEDLCFARRAMKTLED